MGKFGWSYPPGCSGPPNDDVGPCLCCGRYVDDCICDECSECGNVGDPECYKEHGMLYSPDQIKGQAKMEEENYNTIMAELSMQASEDEYRTRLEEEY